MYQRPDSAQKPHDTGEDDTSSLVFKRPDDTWYPLVLKVFDAKDYLRWYGDLPQESCRKEIEAYAGPLTNMQGVVVPKVYDTWVSQDGGHGVMLMEEVGDQVCFEEDWSDVPPHAAELIRKLYDTLHEAGVAHGGVHRRHFRWATPDSRSEIRLIDFDQALYPGALNASDGSIKQKISAERERLRVNLGWTVK